MDLASIAGDATVAKTVIDAFRSALGLFRDAQGILPEGEKKDAIGASLDAAERQLRLAEAQIAQSLGCRLCQCEFPPAPMSWWGISITKGPRRKAAAGHLSVPPLSEDAPTRHLFAKR